ncbi:EamA family transporter [Plesiomonas shigelloides]|uniref:DMT family transporter n=1 Tax=Plesiomonas shigelloides TaxID=703 RepID=UPI001261CF69|nr:DMT family transporter [Plesiomonas shigelloides]KAB7694202.1 EamA family transporter [Plesiomonas shigelloides]
MLRQQATIGCLLALLTAVFWGALPIAMKQALEVLDPYTIVWFRFVSATLGLGLWLAWRRGLPSPVLLWRNYRALLLVATLGLAGNFLLFNSALQYLSPAVVQVVIQLAPVLLLLASVWILKEPLQRHQGIGLLLLLGGMLLFFNERLYELFTSLSSYTLGVLLAVAAAVVWVAYGVAQKLLLRRLSSPQILLVLYTLSALLFTPMAQPQQAAAMDMRQWGMLLFCCLNTLVGYGAFAEAMARWEAAKVSAIVTLAPLFTILFLDLLSVSYSALFTAAPLNLLGYIGALVVVAGAMFSAIGHRLLPPRAVKPVATESD